MLPVAHRDPPPTTSLYSAASIASWAIGAQVLAYTVFHNDKNVSVSKVALLLFAGIEQNASTTGTNRFSTTLQGSSLILPLQIPGVWDALELRSPGINVRERGELHTPADDVTLLAFAAPTAELLSSVLLRMWRN